MYSLFIALGTAASKLAYTDLREISGIDARSGSTIVKVGEEFLALISVPKGNGPPLVCGEQDGQAQLMVDGYITVGNRVEHTNIDALPKLLLSIQERGISSALSDVVAGSFNLVYADNKKNKFVIATDEFGSIPLYYSLVKGGLVASTSPMSIVGTGLISDRPDWIACSSLLYFGYTIGNRYLLSDISRFPSGSFLTWQNGQASFHPVGVELKKRVPDVSNPSTSVIAELMKRACERVARVDGRTAHLQSAGMDSRLILAAYPAGTNPTCYTYGHQDSTEIQVAKRVAETRGSVFTHLWPDGDTVADCLDDMFQSNGLMVYPDRYVVSRQAKEDGFNNILDGYLGDVLLGGSYYKSDRDFSAFARLAGSVTTFLDLSISKIGLRRISTVLSNNISEIHDLRGALPFLSADFALEIEKHRPFLVEEIENECKRLSSESDSLGLLYRNFLLQNRGIHAISQQGIMCRSFLRPLYPFTNDRDLLDACLRMVPGSIAYRKFYIRLFRTQFPDYARIEYGESMIPLKHSPLIHRVYRLLARTEGSVLANRNRKLKFAVSPNNWSHWLRNSDKLRANLSANLSKSNIVDTVQFGKFLTELQSGKTVGDGKLFHLASISKWLL